MKPCPLFEPLVVAATGENPGALIAARGQRHRARCPRCDAAAIRLTEALSSFSLAADCQALEHIDLLRVPELPSLFPNQVVSSEAEQGPYWRPAGPSVMNRLVAAMLVWGLLLVGVVAAGFLAGDPSLAPYEELADAGRTFALPMLPYVVPLLCPILVFGLLAPLLMLHLVCREGQCLI